MFGYYFPKGFTLLPNLKAEPINPVSCNSKRDPDGMPCMRCEEFFFMVEANQEDGNFKCYQCRQDPYR